MRHLDFSAYVFRYSVPNTDAQGEGTRVMRELPLGFKSRESALAVAREYDISLSADPNLQDFKLVCPDDQDIEIDISGVERVDETALGMLSHSKP